MNLVSVRISVRTILLVAVTVVVVVALASIRSVLLVLFVSVFGVAVLSPPAAAMERRFGWSRRASSVVLVLAIVIVVVGVALIMVAAVGSAVHGLSHDLPRIADQARHSGLGHLIDKRSGSLEALTKHASEITSGAGRVSHGVAHVGVSAFGGIAVVFSVFS
jgi:Domain of unknown function DUF20.